MTDESSYVLTKTIKDAVVGHEEEILDALAIPFRMRAVHIPCPYPDHGSDGLNWRWDAVKKKAFCSCSPHADNAIEVLRKCEGLDFDAAKIRVAAIIGRDDLIKTKGGKGGQKTDAFSLLNPPSGVEDKGLPRAYLAQRLGIEPGQVSMPATHAAGWKALAYYDAPAKGSTKPVHVGDFPACVFQTVAADGTTHAHRIYVAPGGAGKAVLGKNAAGYERDPKKSAKVKEGDTSTAGRSVLWGDVATAEHVVIAEGIETAAAIAYAMRLGVAAGTVVVAAAVTAGGIEAFQPYPATRRITVAADRDEKITISKPVPSRRGEKAAREFGMRHHERIHVDIAMPGQPGSSVDWLDILGADGETAVLAGVENAIRFEPTPAEVADAGKREEQAADLIRIAKAYPLPEMSSRTLFYEWAKGRPWVHHTVVRGKGEEKEFVDLPICTPIGFPARLRLIDQVDSYGIRLVLEDMNGEPRNIDVERGEFAKVGAAEARTLLYMNGLAVESGGEQIVIEMLKAARPTAEIIVVRRPGWQTVEWGPDPFFMCPDGTPLGPQGGHIYELSTLAKISPHVAHAGTLQGWKDAVAAAAAVHDCQHFVLGIAAGFAGVLVSLCGLDTCGVNLSGKTSLGKTTAQRLAVSSWSKPVPIKDGLFQSARATTNSLEAVAARANGTVLVLDELGHISGAEVGKLIYMVAGGVGKGRMTAGAALRDSYTWSTFAFFSAETSLEEKIRADGEVMKGGQVTRFPDVDVTGVNGQVSPLTMSKIEGVRQHYGHAGPAFVAAMIEHGRHRNATELQAAIRTIATRLAKDAGISTEADSALARAAQPFAILYVAGTLARELGVVPASVDVPAAIQWAWNRFKESNEAVALDPKAQVVMNLRRWIAERWNTSIQWLDAEARPIKDALGWWDDDAVYIPDHRLVEAAGGALKETQIAQALHGLGYIAKCKSERHFSVGYVPKVGKLKAYALSRKQFGRGSGHTENEAQGLKVYEGGLL